MTILGKLNSFVSKWTGDGGAAEGANDLSHGTPPPLPAYPWDAPPTSPPPPTDASIALTLPDRPTAIYEGSLLPDNTRPRLEQHPDNAKRRKSSDGTRVPNPAHGYQGPVAMAKPGAGKSFHPINNLNGNAIADRINPRHGRKQTTYGKQDRNTKSIGLQRHSGQQQYLERNPGHKPAMSYSYSVSHASPLKRRKTEHPNAVQQSSNAVFEVEDSDDEIQQVAPPARQASTPRARSTLSSRSPHSTASKQSGVGAKLGSQPMSEFANTDNLVKPKRAIKPRRPGSKGPGNHHREPQVELPFLGAGSFSQRLQGQSVSITDDDVEILGTARRSLLQGFEQGVDHESNSREQLKADTEKVTSEYFPSNRMRINESTAEMHDRIARVSRGDPPPTRNLREYRAAENAALEIDRDPVEGSDDELAQLTTNTPKTRWKQSPSKCVPKSKGDTKRKGSTGKCYKLDYARAYDLEAKSKKLLLRQNGDDPKSFRITDEDREGNIETLHTVNVGKVNSTIFDNLTRMRLMGPVIDGNRYWFDLKFKDCQEFREFRDTLVVPEALQKLVYTEKMMIDLFKKPLEKNNKIGKSPIVSEKLSSDQEHPEQQPRRNNLKQYCASTRAPTRTARSTRATAPIHDQGVTDLQKEVEKFSVKVGLGRPWPNQLEFNVEEDFLRRRRCTVNFEDLFKLHEGEMLNDNLVNFYMLQVYMYNDLKVSIDRVFFFNTYFFESLTKNTKGRDAINYDAVRSWTRRDDVFSYDYIVVPINENFHWYLAIICNVSKIARKPAVDDLEESHDLEQTTTETQTNKMTSDSNNDSIAEHQGKIGGSISALGEPVVKETLDNDEENLFEEEKKLSLIDRDEEGVGEGKQPSNEQDGPAQQTLQDESATAALSSAQADNTSPNPFLSQSKQASKKKGKRRPTAPRKDPRKPVIMILDSMSGVHSNATRALREWLQAEGLEKRGMTVEIDNKGHYSKSAQIPMQNNFSDCGLYVLGYARKFFGDPDGFKKKLLTGEMSAETDWPDMDPLKMRSDLRKLIFRLYDAQKEAHKAKKAPKAKDAPTSPTEAGRKRTSPAVLQPSTFEADTSAIVQAAAQGEPSWETTVAKAAAPPAVTPRLGSPFNPRVQPDNTRSSDTENLVKDNASTSSSNAATPTTAAKIKLAQPQQAPGRRLGSPDVRVPAKSPHIDTSSYVRYDGATDRSRQPAQQPTDLTSFLQEHELHSKDNGKPRMPSAKKAQAGSPSRPTRKRPVFSSPLQPRTRSGSHDDPITLDDSQDLDAAAQDRPQLTKKPSPDVIELDRSQESYSAPVSRAKPTNTSSLAHRKSLQQALPHHDSLQGSIGYEREEGRDVTRALKLPLEDEARRLSQQSNSSPHKLNHTTEDVYDAQGAYSESSHTVQRMPETQAMEVDDEVVAETPERQRSSPALYALEMKWQAGDSLPI